MSGVPLQTRSKTSVRRPYPTFEMNQLRDPARETTPADLHALTHTNGALRVGVLTNPLSGKNRRGHYVKTRKLLMDNPQVINRDVRTPEQIDTALKDFAHKGVGLVVISGGDGTVQATLTSLLRQRPFETLPLLAILAAGTTNMNARDVGITTNPTTALRKLLAWANTPTRQVTVKTRSILRIQPTGEEAPLYGMFFGVVGIVQGTRFFHNQINPKGFKGEYGPAVALLKLLYDWVRGRNRFLHSENVTIEVDGQPAEQREILLLVVSTLERLMLGLRPFWGGGRGALHYTRIDAKAAHLLRVLPALVRGRRHPRLTAENGYFSENVDRLRVSTRGGFSLDGEIYPSHNNEPIVLSDGGSVSFLSV